MKKFIFSLAFLVATAGAAHAQGLLKSVVSNLSFGIKGGGGAATFTGSGATHLTYAPSFSGGAFMALKVTEHFSIQEDFLYTQKGAQMEDFLLAGNKLKATLGYGEVAFMLRYAFGQGGHGLFLEAGPTGSFFLHQRDKVENSAGTEVASLGTRNDDFTKVVAGYAGGIGYKFGNGLQVAARYSGDLMPVYKKDLGYPELFNSAAQLQVGYTFGRKGK